MKKFAHILLFCFAFTMANAQGNAVHINDTLGEFLLNTLHITDRRIQEPVYGFRSDSTDLFRYKSTTIGTLITRQGLALVNSYGANGSVQSIRVAGLPTDYVNINWNGLQLNSTSLGMADLSLIPVIFIDEMILSERHQVNGQQDLALGNNLNLSNQLRQEKTIEFFQFASSLRNSSLGLVWNNQKNKWHYNIRAFIADSQNKFQYQDLLQVNKPWLEQHNNNTQEKGAMCNMSFKGAKRITSLHLYSIYRNAYLPIQMGGLELNSNKQIDQQNKFSLVNKGPYKEWSEKRISEYEWLLGGAFDKQYYQSDFINSKIKNQSAFGSFHYRNKGEQLTYSTSASLTSDVIYYEDWNNRIQFQTFRMNEQIGFNCKRNMFLLNLNPQLRTTGHSGLSGELQWSIFKHQFAIESSLHHKERLPDGNELYWQPGGNLNLKKESARGIDVGLKWESLTDDNNVINRMCFQFSARADVIQNWIQWVPMTSGIWSPQNVKEVHYAQSKFRFNLEKKHMNVLCFFEPIYSRGRNHSSQQWFQTTYSPQWRGGGNIEFKHQGARFIFEANAVGKRFTDEENTEAFALPTAAYFNLEVGKIWKVNHTEWNCFFRIENIANTQFSFVRGYALPGRVFSIQINYQLKQKQNEN